MPTTPASQSPIDARHTITVIGQSELVTRLPEALNCDPATVRAIGLPNSPLRSSRFVGEFIEISPDRTTRDFNDLLLQRPDVLEGIDSEWVFCDNDLLPFRIARSDLPLDVKLRVLPTRKPEGLELIGSKVGLAAAMDRWGIPGPVSRIAESEAELHAVAAAMPTPFLVKADLGGGGVQVRKVTDRRELLTQPIPADWFPAVVQELIEGTEASIEALFREGRLVGWAYSQMLGAAGRFGPSTHRRYVDPPDRGALAALEHLGEQAGLHGFFNCSLIWSPERQRHFLFELDPRANAWHPFGPALGADWATAMFAPSESTAQTHPHFGEHGGRVLHLYPRELQHVLTGKAWRAALPWLVRAPGTWETRLRRDRAVNAAERRRLLIPLVLLPWFALPKRLREFLRSTVVGARIKARIRAALHF